MLPTCVHLPIQSFSGLVLALWFQSQILFIQALSSRSAWPTPNWHLQAQYITEHHLATVWPRRTFVTISVEVFKNGLQWSLKCVHPETWWPWLEKEWVPWSYRLHQCLLSVMELDVHVCALLGRFCRPHSESVPQCSPRSRQGLPSSLRHTQEGEGQESIWMHGCHLGRNHPTHWETDKMESLPSKRILHDKWIVSCRQSEPATKWIAMSIPRLLERHWPLFLWSRILL